MVLAVGALVVGGGTASADPTASEWQRLRQCESGDNYTINTGNGYYGAYQFDLSTWRSVGGTGYPHQASRATQDALALKLWQQRGWSPWTCASILGLGTSTVAPPPPALPTPPRGSVDAVAVSELSATVSGWAYDPDVADRSIDVHVYVNGRAQAVPTDRDRSDVNAVFGITGRHGYSVDVTLTAGKNTVCVYAIGTVRDNNTLLSCRDVVAVVPPRGSWDGAAVDGQRASLSGWAFDPSASGESIETHVYVNGKGYAFRADQARADVNAVFGIPGRHGFSVSVPLSGGANEVCVFAIGRSAGNNLLIGCRTLQGVAPVVPPRGSWDGAAVDGLTASLSGWTFDPSASGDSIETHVYVNGKGYGFRADQARNDVNAVFGISGRHGFSVRVPLSMGPNEVCVFGIGRSAGNNTLIGCRTVQGVVPPRGAIDAVTRSGNNAVVSGWTFDPMASGDSIETHVYVNGSGYGFRADQARADVNAVFGISGRHGFSITVPLSAGNNNVCVFGIGKVPNNNTLIGCRDVRR
ncbi:transglycosylase family protein [Nakamurella leprariae]|uniref:transglycosylase family protein n=1 Tax=Nakamurella leprariae TaxID=2803911 RepID=UPI002E28D5A2|nr:transglycosylase family protein [Nakamurella leprariae]